MSKPNRKTIRLLQIWSSTDLLVLGATGHGITASRLRDIIFHAVDFKASRLHDFTASLDDDDHQDIIRLAAADDSVVVYEYFNEPFNDGAKGNTCDTNVSHERQAQERIQEFNRLKKARQLLDAISLTNELLADGSDVEILSLASTIIKRFKVLGVFHVPLENSSEVTRSLIFKAPHSGIYHCCTFCSSGGKKEATCGCGGTMPGGYKGCGHGHIGHPGVPHWSCCGSILHHGHCLALQKYMHQLLF